MRAFSIFAVALAASVNAATLSKRDISSGVQACINGFNDALPQLGTVTSKVNSFTRAAGYPGAIAVHSEEQKLEALLKSTTTACCAVTTTVSNEEADAVISVIDTVVPQIEAALAAITVKKPEFDAVLLATNIVKGDIKNLDSQVTTLDNCLVAVTPDSYLDVANGYVTRVRTAFDTAEDAYGI
ncbi:uncharacterized protein BX663DRAFT_558787 [Cokeromyces recurvatus]|uniref:uncharacterized protein n=1 Tax=Cokeromyces recurvatus TaxID=90255 RepID=UPI0022210564|nr:uncharacterized protein BX663DRAFT_558787 [Cokeromyces recurvatus]KAI7906256.1 hypothetical protein BX663DRAFT_558787 [Cokeromyces recurvatus]